MATTRLHALGIVLARRAPAAFAAMTSLQETMVDPVDPAIAAERTPTVPVAHMAKQVLSAALDIQLPVSPSTEVACSPITFEVRPRHHLRGLTFRSCSAANVLRPIQGQAAPPPSAIP